MAQNDRLRKATREVEGYFVGVLLKKMHETAAKSPDGKQDSSATMYREMLDDAIAHEIGKKGAFGIGDMLYREMIGSLDRGSDERGAERVEHYEPRGSTAR